jgi:aromatic ring-opening dioxygenase catalytic subunit (LigB family)
MQRSSAGEIAVITYSYHWANADNQLIKRWDNAPHFPDLPGFPDHIHDGATGEVTSGQPMSISAVLDEIAGRGL